MLPLAFLLYVSRSPVGWIRTNISVFGALNETINCCQNPGQDFVFKLYPLSYHRLQPRLLFLGIAAVQQPSRDLNPQLQVQSLMCCRYTKEL